MYAVHLKKKITRQKRGLDEPAFPAEAVLSGKRFFKAGFWTGKGLKDQDIAEQGELFARSVSSEGEYLRCKNKKIM